MKKGFEPLNVTCCVPRALLWTKIGHAGLDEIEPELALQWCESSDTIYVSTCMSTSDDSLYM